MTMITPSYLGETIEYSSLHACRSTLEDPTNCSSARPARVSLSHRRFTATFNGTLGAYCVLAKVIRHRPEVGDRELLLSIRPDLLPRGMPQFLMLDAVEALAAVESSAGMRELQDWLSRLPHPTDSFTAKLKSFSARSCA